MGKNNTFSPLRYPGGKACLTNYISDIIRKNNIVGGTYYEFYAGGAGAALGLLFNNVVDKIVLNDADIHIYAFWNSILNQVDEFISLILDTPVNIEEWHKQKYIYENPSSYDLLVNGFSTFFLNRCNRSGILTKAGPIGGRLQEGKYHIDARYNKEALINRIRRIHKYKACIEVFNTDTIILMKELASDLKKPSSLLYLDPPYYNKGKSLYLNYYNHNDHVELRDLLSQLRDNNWLVSYDQVQPIAEMYMNFNHCNIDIAYSLQSKKKMGEIFIFSDKIVMPTNQQLPIYELQ